MRRILILCFATLTSLLVRAQLDTSILTVSSSEVHIGIGAQKFLHCGARQILGTSVGLEVDLGILPKFERGFNSYYNYALGLSIIPTWKKYDSGNFLFTLLYSVATEIDVSTKFYRIFTGNFGWLRQTGPGLSIIIRAGIGIANGNNQIQDDMGGYVWKRDLVPWGNVEGSIGYAF